MLFQWVDARNKFLEAADLIDAEKSMRKSMWGQFWSAHQRFFKYLCISSKVKYAVKIAKEALRSKKVYLYYTICVGVILRVVPRI